jgi:hypothetical protein
MPKLSNVAYNNDLNSIRSGTSVIYEIKPDNRYGINFGYELKNYNILNRDYIISSQFNGLVHTFWAEAFLNIDANSIIFFRPRFSFSPPIQDGNFLQVQLGYLFDLFNTSNK